MRNRKLKNNTIYINPKIKWLSVNKVYMCVCVCVCVCVCMWCKTHIRRTTKHSWQKSRVISMRENQCSLVGKSDDVQATLSLTWRAQPSVPARLRQLPVLLLRCVRLCDSMNCHPPGSSVHGVLQARTRVGSCSLSRDVSFLGPL